MDIEREEFQRQGDLAGTLSFVKGSFMRSLREINPCPNFRVMHTNVGPDILAGVVVAVVALPLALAFGVGSGLGPITGLYGAIAGGIIGSLFGGSLVGVSGPTGPKMAQLAMIMVGFRLASGEPDLVAAFSMIFFSGVILVVIALLGVSRLIYFTPYSVVAGFMCGIGVIVMILEFDSFMGHDPVHSVMEGIRHIPHTLMNPSAEALMISIPTLAILFLWPRLVRNTGRLKLVPAPLLGLIVGTAIANFGGMNVHYIGDIPTGMPELYWPDWSRFGELFVPAAGLAGLAVFDSLLTCIVADHMLGTKHSSDRESFGQGLANMAAGFCGGLTTATATMRTVANIQSGGRTPLASFVHGLVLLALVLGLGPYAEQIPMACLAAILFKVGIDILDYRIMPVLHRLPASDMIVFWTVFIITIVEDLLVAMGVGLVLAFFRFAQEMSRVYKAQMMSLNNYTDDDELLQQTLGERVKVLKPHGPLFFGSVQQLEETFEKASGYDVLLVKLKDVTMMDLSGAYALENLAEKARENGKEVVFCNAPDNVRHVLERVKVLDHSADIHYCEAIDEAIRKIENLYAKPSPFAA